MGGSFRSHGNSSPVAEFNYWVDPHSAKYVYEQLHRPVIMVGLDVTRKIVLTPDLLELIRHFDNDLSRFIISITKFYVNFHWKQERILGCVINDPLAVAVCIAPDLCSGFDSYVTVETEGLCMGQTIVDSGGFWKYPSTPMYLRKPKPVYLCPCSLNVCFQKKPSLSGNLSKEAHPHEFYKSFYYSSVYCRCWYCS